MARDVDAPARGARSPAASASRASGPKRRRQARAVVRRRARRPSRRRDRSSTATRSPSSGWASGASGSTNSTPCAAEVQSGRTATPGSAAGSIEQTSWRNPGSVSSWVRVPPPIVGGRLDDVDAPTGAGEGDRRGEAVRPRADDDRVERAVGHGAACVSGGSPIAVGTSSRDGSARLLDHVARIVDVTDLDLDVLAGREAGHLPARRCSPRRRPTGRCRRRQASRSPHRGTWRRRRGGGVPGCRSSSRSPGRSSCAPSRRP